MGVHIHTGKSLYKMTRKGTRLQEKMRESTRLESCPRFMFMQHDVETEANFKVYAKFKNPVQKTVEHLAFHESFTSIFLFKAGYGKNQEKGKFEK